MPEEPVEETESQWEEKTIFSPAEDHHQPDEVGKPLPADYSEDVMLPRKWNAKIIESDYVKIDNVEDYMKPIHETDYWPLVEFDPAFARDGRLPCGDPLPNIAELEDQYRRSDSSESGEVCERPSKRGRASDDSSGERPWKRQRSHSPSNVGPRGSREDNRASMQDTLGPRSYEAHRDATDSRRRSDAYQPSHRRSMGRRASYNRDRDRSRSRSRSKTPASRRSSVSDASLDSLEAELLGVDTKAKSPEQTLQRPGSASKPKRRQTKLDSAYR